MDNEIDNNEIVAYAVLVGEMFVIDGQQEETFIDEEYITEIKLGRLHDGCKMFTTADDAQKVADLCNGEVKKVKFEDE